MATIVSQQTPLESIGADAQTVRHTFPPLIASTSSSVTIWDYRWFANSKMAHSIYGKVMFGRSGTLERRDMEKPVWHIWHVAHGGDGNRCHLTFRLRCLCYGKMGRWGDI